MTTPALKEQLRKQVRFGKENNLLQSINSAVVIDNSEGFEEITFSLTIPTTGTVTFEGTFDGTNWSVVQLRKVSTSSYVTTSTTSDTFTGPILGMQKFRVRVSTGGSADGSVIGTLHQENNNYSKNSWTQFHEPSADTQATCTQASPGANLKNVVTGISATLAGGSAAPAAVQLYVRLVEDIAGTPATIYSASIALPATAGAFSSLVLTNLWIPVTSNKSITLRFSAAGGSNTYQAVSMQGVVVAENNWI